MTHGETWRPLGIDSDDEVAEYDALHDAIPSWMASAFWAWVRVEITRHRRYSDGSGSVAHLNESLVESMCQMLRVPLPNLRYSGTEYTAGQKQLASAMEVIKKHANGLQVADYILAHSNEARANDLEVISE